MNKLISFLVTAMFLVLLPLKPFAQPTRITNIEPMVLFDITDIANFDERVYFLYNLTTDGRFDVTTSEQDGIFVVSATEALDDMNLTTAFDDFRDQNANDFTRMSKEQAADVASDLKGLLPYEFISSLMMDYYRSRLNNTCANADPFCTDNGMYQFPAGVNAGSGESGPYYDCLYSQPNPAWYYMRIANPGSITIHMYSTPSVDIDFCCWGPYSTITNPSPCSNLTQQKVVSCSYSTSATENCIIPASAQTGDYFILVITNYSNQTCNINFSKTAGTGTTDCGILPPMVDNDGPYCVGETIHLTANGQAGASYSWSGPAGFTSNQQNPTRTNCTMAMAGTYTCTITVGNQTNSATTEVDVVPQPTANFTFTNVCRGEPTQFTNTSTTNPSGQTMSYQWNFGDGQTSTQQNPTHTYANAGTYTVTLTVSCGNGHCTSTKTQSVVVYAEPNANAGPDQTIPFNTSTQLSGSGGAGTFNFHWEPANMVTNPNSQNTQTVVLTQDQTYTLTVTNSQGQCSGTDQVTIHIEGGALTVSASASPASICAGSSTQLTASAGGGMGNSTYSWTPTTGLSNPNIYNPVASPTQTTTYTCTVTNSQTNQTATASVTVVVHHAGFSEETHYICPGDLYEWHGQSYSDENDYEFLTQTIHGCDSTITLHLRHYPTYDETTIEAAICSGESYNFYGTTYNTTTQTLYHDQTIHGCDSIVRLELTVWPENEVTEHPVSLCPEQLPYYYEEDPYEIPLYAGLHIFHLEDIHGCDSTVWVEIEVNDYYMPPIQQVYRCYETTPSYDWYIPEANTTITYYEEGFYTDTLATANCDGIFRLDLHFQQIPETIVEDVVTCDSYTWPMTGQTYTESDSYYHYVSLAPFPCQQEYKLNLTINTQSILDEKSYSGVCDEIPVSWFGQDTTFTANTVYTFTGLTDEGCYREQTYRIEDMHYTPHPDRIMCSDASAIVFGDTIAVVTNTEFFSFQYTFFVEETNRECVWESCNWAISKPSWTTEFNPVPALSLNGTYYSECTVYVADRQNEHVELTATINNDCGSEVRKFYLKSSFLDVDENEYASANVNIVPNPNNGQMHIDFENMEGHTAVKVFDMTGNQIDAFETHINSNRYNYDYNLKKHADGIYFFVISNNNRVLTKKVVIIH